MTAQAPALCIIPARGGSKRIPRKNIRPFRGTPILARAVATARDSGLFDRIMVSTDDDAVAEVAAAAGAEVPFRRSAATSDDHATTSAVLEEVLARYRETGAQWPLACCLYPTAALALPSDLAEGRALLVSGGFDMVMPVAAFSYPVWRSLRRDTDGRLAFAFPEHRDTRSQDLPPAYHDAGQWYWFRTEALARNGGLMGPDTGSLLLPQTRVQDIDTEEDWALAEIKHRHLFG